MKNDEILHKWINNTITEEELTQFKLRPEYDSLVELYDHTRSLKPPKVDTDQVLNRILTSEKANVTQKSNNPIIRKVGWVKYAAAACMILIAGFFFMERGETEGVYFTKVDESVEMQLPDGSYFALEEESRLQFDPQTFTTERNIFLDGAATFDVTQGSKFLVTTAQGTIEVLGTTFRVVASENKLEVACEEGKVLVSTITGNLSDVITKDQSITLENNVALVAKKDNVTTLKNVTLKDALDVITEEFGALASSIDVDMSERVTCSFQHEDLEKALTTTLAPLGVKFKIVNENTIVLSK